MATLPEESFDQSSMQPYYSFIKSINNDLVLLGNALMTRNNDLNSIYDFVADSINTIGSEELKLKMHTLNNKVMGCDNDEDRLRFLAKMQYTLAEAALPYISSTGLALLQELSSHLKKVEASKSHDLKANISRFQIDILKFIPGIEHKDHEKLMNQAEKIFEKSKEEWAHHINDLYEDINLLIQPPFDDL